MTLAEKACVPCRGGVPPMEHAKTEELLRQLGGGWELARDRDKKGTEHDLLRKTYAFKNFREALTFANAVGELAENQNHHPDMRIAWGEVVVEIWTHKISGLTESDFIFAAKCDKVNAEGSS